MAGRRATGHMTLHLDINNAAVGYKLRTLKREISQVNRAWKSQAHMLWISGQREAALREKMQGLQHVQQLEHTFVLRAKKVREESNRAQEEGSKKYQRLEVDIENARKQENLYKEQIERTKDSLTLHNNELLRTSRIQQHNLEEGRARVEELQAEGRETDANKQKTENYNTRLKDLNNRYQAVNDTIDRARKKHLDNPYNPDYTRNETELHKLGATIARTKREQNDFNNKLTTGKQYDDLYNQATNKLIASLKRMKQSTQANRVEYNRLIGNQDREAQTLDKERNKAAQIAQESGRNSNAYQREYSRLISLNSAYAEHVSRINVLKDTYGRMSHRVATNIDNQRLKIRRLNLDSHRELTTAHSLTNASFALGAGFIYGAHQAMGLENEFNKVRNLLNTSGESYRQSTKDIHKMGKATEQYSLQYGVSQNEISKGFGSLVRRGYTGNQALAAQKSYLQGAIASGDKYSDVMDTAASTLESFGLRSNNTKKMVNNTKVAVNQLAYAADATSSDFRGIGYGMKFVGATAHSANQSVSETSSALGVLSNNGQNATNAGFGLRKVLNSFIAANHTKVWKKILPKLGLSPSDFQDAEGHFKKLSTMMSILQSHLGGKTDAEKTDIFHQLFGATGQESGLILANNTRQLSTLNGQVAKSQNQAKGQGYAARIAGKNMNSTQMQMKRLQMAGEDLAKDYAQGLNPAFKRFAGASLKVAEVMSNFNKPTKDAIAIGTALIPVVAGVNYGLSALNKVHALSIKTSLRMMGIGRNEQEQLRTKIDTSNVATQANNRKNQSLTNTIKLYQQEQEAEAGASRAEKDNTVTVEDNNSAVKSGNMGMIDHVRMMSHESADRLRNNSTLARWNNATGGSIGTGMAGKAGLRYGGAGFGMGTLIGGTEALNGNLKNGAEDFVGTTGGTALGGVIGGPMGAMIGGTAGPMIAKSIGDKIIPAIDHPYHVGNNLSINDSEDRGIVHRLNDDLKHVDSDTTGFVRKEAALNNRASYDFAANGGKVTKSLRRTAVDMYNTAQRYGDLQVKNEDNTLQKAAKDRQITNRQAIAGESRLQSSESSVTAKVSEYDSKAMNNTHLTASQREKDLSKADSYEMKLTSLSGKNNTNLLSDLNRRTGRLNTKSYATVLSQASSNFNATKKSASARYKNQIASAKNAYSTLERAGVVHGKSASKSVSSLERLYGSQRADTVSKASKTSASVSAAASKMADNTTKKHYQASQSVSAANKSMASDNARIASDNAKAWHDFTTGLETFFQTALYDIRHPLRPHENKDVFKSNLKENPLAKHSNGTPDTQHVVVDNPVTQSFNPYSNGSYDTAALHFAKGVLPGITHNENAVVNDGGGRELIKLPNGQFVLPSGRNVHTILPRGTSVFNAMQTRRILGMINQPSVHHASGTIGNLGNSKISGSVRVKTPNGSLDKTEKSIRQHMKNIHDVLDKGYKESNKDVQKHLDNLHDNSDDSWSDNYEKTKQHVQDIHDDTSDQYNDLKNDIDNTQKQANDLTNNHLNTTVGYFKHHFAMIPPISRSSMRSGVANINSGISAIDRVLNQFGGNAHVLNAVHYAAGTSGPFMDKQLAILNDATSGPTQEAVVSDQGRVRMPRGRNVLTALNPGDKVLNGSDTLRAIRSGMIPHYAQGKDSHKGLLDMIHYYAKTPSNFTNGTFNKFAIIMGNVLSQGITSTSKKGAQSPANVWSNAMWNYINSLVSESNSKIISYAKDHFTGKKYRMGANGPTYYDCSGLVDAVMRHFNVNLPRVTTGMQADSSQLRYVGKDPKNANPGNLVIWGHGGGAGGHVGFYEGGNRFFSDMAGFGASSTPLSDVTSLPLAGFYQIKGLHNDQSHINGPLTNLVKHQLGNKSIKWIKDELNDTDMGNPAGSGVTRWIPVIKQAAKRMNANLGGGGLEKVLTTIRHESQGNPTVTQHGYTDANTGGNEAVGLVQFAKSTFPSYSLSGHFNRRNGYDELLALFNDSNWRSDLMPSGGWIPRGHARYSIVPGYAHGGLTRTDKLAHISEGNKPEMVLPLTDRSRAVQLMLKSLQYMFGNNQDNSQRNNDGQASASDREFEKELIRSNRQKDRQINKLSQTTNNILNKMTILIKTVQNKPVISDVDIYNANRKQSLKNLRLRNLNRGSF